MRSNEYLWDKVVMDMYREMYTKSDPSADIDRLVENGTTKKPNWFSDYYLPKEEFVKIFNKVSKKHRLTRKEKEKVSFEVYLGAGPTSVRPPDWDKEEN